LSETCLSVQILTGGSTTRDGEDRDNDST